MVKALALLFLAAGPAFAAAEADKDTIKLVEFFFKTETADLPPEAVPAFMEVDPETLPDKTVQLKGQGNVKPVKMKMRQAYKAKKEELLALRKTAIAKKRPGFVPLRTGKEDPKCAEPRDGSDEQMGILRFAGYAEAEEQEVKWVEGETNCTECELETEFSLIRVSSKETGKGKKGASERVRYFFHELDPIWVLIGAHRAGKNPFGTAFFGTGKPTCH